MSDNNTFGIHSFEEEPGGFQYTASETGMILVCKDKPPMVLSFVNGSMCVNPLGQRIDASNFDEFVYDVIEQGYHFVRQGPGTPKQGKPIIAYYDPDTQSYVEVPPAYIAEAALERENRIAAAYDPNA